MVLVLLVGPNLISQDLRYNALPLYFSRPLRRMDYLAGKLGVIVALLVAIIIVPSLVAYMFGLLFSLDITIIRDTSRILLGQRCVWFGDCAIGGDADAGAFVAFAQLAICRHCCGWGFGFSPARCRWCLMKVEQGTKTATSAGVHRGAFGQARNF